MDCVKGRRTEVGRLRDVVLQKGPKNAMDRQENQRMGLDKIGNGLMLREMLRRRKLCFFGLGRD